MSHADRIEDRLRAVSMEVLGVDDPEEMSAEALMEAIREESIDVLDLQFRCEREFRVRMDVNRLVDPAMLGPLPDGKLSAEAIRRLREQLPFLETGGVQLGAPIDSLRDLLTFENVARIIRGALAGEEAVLRVASVV